jgi:hypothetical protein
MGEWTFRLEEHLGAPAFSLFDPAGERSAVGLIRWDAERICRAMNTTPELLEALTRILKQPNETASDGKALREIVRIARSAIAKATGAA